VTLNSRQGIAVLILNFSIKYGKWSVLHTGGFTPWARASCPHGIAGLTPELVWTFLRFKPLAHTRTVFLCHPAPIHCTDSTLPPDCVRVHIKLK